MKKSLITLLALSCAAMADNMLYVGPTTSTDWNAAGNWQNNTAEPTHTNAQSGDTITISGANLTWAGVSGGVKFNGNTVWNITDGATVTLGTKGANTSGLSSNPRFDGSWNISEDSTVNVCAMFLNNTSNIFGTVTVNSYLNPGTATTTVNFGEAGVINLAAGSPNGMEGNDRTLKIGAVLTTTGYADNLTSTVYSVEKRYVIAGVEGGTFKSDYYGTLTLSGGLVTDLDGEALSYTASELSATEADFGKYTLGQDAGGVYVSFVKATTPEPATATLSLLALAGLASRRRRH